MNKMARMEDEFKQIQQRTKKNTETINEKEKNVRKLHEIYLLKEARVREIEAKLKEKKTAGNDNVLVSNSLDQ